MMSRLREIRKSRGMTLADVAALCVPPTTAVTIGRLETGTRQLTVPWIEKLAVAAQLTVEGAQPLSETLQIHAPTPLAGTIGLLVRDSQGDYRAGDHLWLEQLPPPRFAEAINTDVLIPRQVGRFVFGRLVATEGNRLHILPARPGARQTVIADAPWLGRVQALIRRF